MEQFWLGDEHSTISMVLTVNNRSPEVSKQVADSLLLDGNHPDELIVVLDRAEPESSEGAVQAYVDLPFCVRFVIIKGDPGWLGPAKAWNMGFQAAVGDLVYCLSSEVVQDEGNVEKAKAICKDGKTVVFGSCHNSTPENLVVGAEPGLLVSSKMPRPLGFIVCIPYEKIEEIGGFDERFMYGFWYDDDDFFLRLWRTGLNFAFDDSIHGVHLHHNRPDLSTREGQTKIQTNRDYMLAKHGTTNPWRDLIKSEERSVAHHKHFADRLTWRHV